MASCGPDARVRNPSIERTRSGMSNIRQHHVLQLTSKRSRDRRWYCAAFVGTIAIGLASRSLPPRLQDAVGKYPGDALWALMVFFGMGALFSRVSTLRLASYGLAFSLAIELLKLYEAPWAVAVRRTTLGHLVFGHVFSWQNLVAYAVGVAAGAMIEFFSTRNVKQAEVHNVA